MLKIFTPLKKRVHNLFFLENIESFYNMEDKQNYVLSFNRPTNNNLGLKGSLSPLIQVRTTFPNFPNIFMRAK